MDNLFDRFNATTESVQPHTDILNGSPLKLNDVSAEKHREEEKTQSCVIVDKQDGGKETSMQKASGTREDRPSSFVIPKKKRHKTDVLLDVKMSSRDFQHEVLPAITKSYRQPQSCARFNYDQVQLVQNPYLTDAYMEKRRELRGYGYVEKELSDSFAFLCMDMENEEEINKICKEGLHIGNSVDSCLGHPKMGVHLCKHADILKPVGLHSGYTGHIIVFKVMKGKIKSVMENRNGSCLEPTPNHDCHVSSTTGNDLGSLNQRDLYESTQLYLYEYGEENVQDVPRNVCPVAVVRFTYKEIKDVKSPDISSPKFLVRSPLSVKAIQSSTQAKDKSSEQKFVVWSGHLTVKGLYACSVEMVSKAGPSKPSRIGKGINITHKMPIAQARKKYLQKVTSISRQQEGFCNGYYVNVCELHPVKPEGKSHFQKVMNYLGKHNCVAIRKLEKDVVLLLLTASELTFQLGLTKPHQYPVILYSIFLSRTTRKHGAVQTDPLVQPVAPTTLPPSQDPHRDKTIPLHISLPPSQSSPHLSDSTKHSTLASPSHTYPSSVCVMPPPPSPTKGMRAAPRVSPVVGASPPKRIRRNKIRIPTALFQVPPKNQSTVF
ncbi:protein TASOR-like [Argopecten irradians]|uniref:protein TASOR-like n=1 Tax=Argopecten irradians TaxID=31199 RepID=UPI0037154452